ncbi:TPA: DNA mismatch repair protein MutT [candidate division CPR2 bacterium]|uniref:MutT/nudix family protein n=1 Tax=candidate division CPR2 bacterium GW2011_GWC1_41_48 TaxID=1618344 RepID=A0A0G0YK04_UNCC2|nr:MAG: MutT/NUDIX family protein [candidate division CPR2 bacterium GW2011_GWC2_39_35]KKR27631.1 MAG: MutT/NUDIX family protein [candidate division CPR2 bacterium GW2011_GWD1_39_7]KKR28838.1 MAG: MutT/NUDIX family protein [candidate division CPR2 bacterium GW2011_GWD2_39_7]KKS09881.1 MAG: MutT/nudix family protein [candidate division CPR2 bacterium GW2011_GWC1_41_48]OGB59453.1 MAG: hypothetical protein A2Y27_03880 [candidate division CPR2 bacterium GWD1_39_7]OGB73183.1 MAG: hypothetical prote
MKAGKDYIGVGCGPLIVNDKNETLLLKRGASSKNEVGFWQKPGGEVEFNERVEDAIKREAKEELGIEIEILDFLGYSDHIIKNEGQHWIGFNYLAEIVNGKPTNMEPHKIDEIGWFNINDLPENVNQTTLEAIEVYKKMKGK